MRAWLQQWLCMIPGVVLAGYAIDGIVFDNPWKLVLMAAVLSLLNLFVRPLLIFFALPFILLTLGLGVFLINAVLLYFAGALVPGFDVTSFGAALLGSLLASLVNVIVALFFGPGISGRSFHIEKRRGPRAVRRKPKEDVIDV